MYCFKIFYTLKPSIHIKINLKKLLQHVSVPLDHHQRARLSYPKVTTNHFLVRYTVVLRAACLCDVLGYVRVPLSMCILRC